MNDVCIPKDLHRVARVLSATMSRGELEVVLKALGTAGEHMADISDEDVDVADDMIDAMRFTMSAKAFRDEQMRLKKRADYILDYRDGRTGINDPMWDHIRPEGGYA